MRIECGPAHDRRIFELELPQTKRIGVMVSGGMDSALLYYILLYLRQEQNSDHYIRPFAVMRKEGSKYHAKPIVSKIASYFGIDDFPTIVGDTTLPEQAQVESGVKQAFELIRMETMFVGVISNRSEHLIGYDKLSYTETTYLKYPFMHLEKSHIVDLFYQLNISELLELTHSCDLHETIHCNKCNGCTEKIWGFTQMGINHIT
jgi:hypothetical protein